MMGCAWVESGIVGNAVEREKEGKTHSSGLFCVSCTDAMGDAENSTGPQKSASQFNQPNKYSQKHKDSCIPRPSSFPWLGAVTGSGRESDIGGWEGASTRRAEVASSVGFGQDLALTAFDEGAWSWGLCRCGRWWLMGRGRAPCEFLSAAELRLGHVPL